MQWSLGEGTTFGQPDKEKSTFEQVLFHVDLPAQGPTKRPSRRSTSWTCSSRTSGSSPESFRFSCTRDKQKSGHEDHIRRRNPSWAGHHQQRSGPEHHAEQRRPFHGPVSGQRELTIYNSEDLTLVRETRVVSFKKGVNPLQFSWANTLIDPTSVRLRFVTHPEKLDLLDTTFPHAKPQMLYWNVQSEIEGEATVEITYFTSGIKLVSGLPLHRRPRREEMGFEGFVRVFNNSGEEYENAQVRLVVGKINLVEKIAQLARITPALRSEVASS